MSPSGRNDVQAEVNSYDDYAREAFSRAVAHLAVTEREQWQSPQAKKLVNEDPIYEIRYKANNRATRALGYFAEGGESFVIVLICYHKGRVYSPAGAFKSAHKRIAQVKDGSASTVSLQVLGEDFPSNED
ncbi:MAG: hypothetical protein GTN84_16495 [Hydrogenophaga sp.]|uniref:hypothetical protein n=1 Tax=Hydrogenophaga TaxID=47420 RepID=UPI0015F2A846|nr:MULTISPECIES: hypothetical protein [Hydrogenophaga]NIM42981.1 hypothetical protein [Hydrogenophaga sp.]NIN27911.1 hypothetical protein [Hydrogenophaga sp.]NIN32688.1 hypothetical protein [Hydrogenophaga sp.]NIN57184.1 hypothetical protein [Hydrogenophaga sp.]NIO53600.1 hypothetical protein [Hydrogenophaga sp.]